MYFEIIMSGDAKDSADFSLFIVIFSSNSLENGNCYSGVSTIEHDVFEMHAKCFTKVSCVLMERVKLKRQKLFFRQLTTIDFLSVARLFNQRILNNEKLKVQN